MNQPFHKQLLLVAAIKQFPWASFLDVTESSFSAESHADPEVYPRADNTVYICGEAESVEPPEDPGSVQPRDSAARNLQASFCSPVLCNLASDHMPPPYIALKGVSTKDLFRYPHVDAPDHS